MTEFEKMRSQQLYNFEDKDVLKHVDKANRICARLSNLTVNSPEYRSLIEELVPGIPASSTINPPFHCDFGNGIRIGKHTFINYDAVMLDGGHVAAINGACNKINTQTRQFYAVRFL